MRTNMAKLRGKMTEAGMNTEKTAKALGMDRATFYRRIKNDGLTFTIGETYRLIAVLHLTKEEAMEVFWGNDW